ncbi:ABC transporter permease [bacterium]|nr:ABC transporter permease [bacterium]
MIRNILKITLRNFWRDKTYTFINLLGLAAGLATCILIFLFVQDELSYDSFHEKAERIFRVETYFEEGEATSHWAATTGNIIPALIDKYPAIETGVKVYHSHQGSMFRSGEKLFNEQNLFMVDSAFLGVFSYDLIAGNPATALAGTNKIVLSESTAKKYFGDEDPMGKSLSTETNTYSVTGIFRDAPVNSHMHFDILLPLDDLRSRWQGVDRRGPSTFYSYILLKKEAKVEDLRLSLATDVYEIMGLVNEQGEIDVQEGLRAELLLNNVRDIHLGGNAEKELESNGSMGYLYLFGAIALFILLIASFNYMNLATARSTGRAREVGVRKVLGAFRSQLFWQFLGESLLMIFLATGFALLAVELILPAFGAFAGKELHLSWKGNPAFWMTLSGVAMTVGFLSGSYPALYLSGFNPLKVLKSNARTGSGKGSVLWLRKGLVVAQFAISASLIIGAVTVYQQLQFISHKNLGFSKEQVLVVPTNNRTVMDQLQVVKETLAKEPEVVSTTATSSIPGKRIHIMSVRIPDLAISEDAQGEEGEGEQRGIRHMRILSVDEDVEETYGLEIVAGRGLSKKFGSDARGGFLLNEAAIREFGLENPIGKAFEYVYGVDTPKVGTIVGIVKDFHYASLHTEVEPLMMHVWPNHYSFLNIRVQTDNMPATLEKIENAWALVVPGVPLDYYFLDDHYNKMYRTEESLGTLMAFFTLLAIFIACLGLFGLSAFTAQQRTREIGIRKVLGASVSDIVLLLSKNFAWLVVTSLVIAIPLAGYGMSQWLEAFAYRVTLSPWVFLAVSLTALGIAIATVSLQSVKAALTNPIHALKDE